MKNIYINLLLVLSIGLFQITKSNPINAEPRRNPDDIKLDPQNEENNDSTTSRKSRHIPKYLAEITDATSHLFEAYNNDYINKNNNNNNGHIYVNSKENSAELSSVVNKFINTVQKTLTLLSSTEENSNSQVSSNLQNVFTPENSFAISVMDLPTRTKEQKLFNEQPNNPQSRINQIDLIYDVPVLNPGVFNVKEASTDFRPNNGFNEAAQSNFHVENKFGSNHNKPEIISSIEHLPKENNLIFGTGDVKSQLDVGNQRDIMFFAALSVPHKPSFDFKESNTPQIEENISSFRSGNSQNTPIITTLDNLPNFETSNVEVNLQQVPVTSTSLPQTLDNSNDQIIFPRTSFTPDIKPLDIPLSSSQFANSVPVFSNFGSFETSTASSFITQMVNQFFPENDNSNKITKLADDNINAGPTASNSFNSQNNPDIKYDPPIQQDTVNFQSFNQQPLQNPKLNQFDLPATLDSRNNFATLNENPTNSLNNFNSLMEIPLEEHNFYEQIRKRLPLDLKDSYGDRVSKFKRQSKKE